MFLFLTELLVVSVVYDAMVLYSPTVMFYSAESVSPGTSILPS